VREALPWSAVASRVEAELGEPIRCLGTLGRARPTRASWAAKAEHLGALVVKARKGDAADEKTRWCALYLPTLAERGYPVPEILWHGALDGDWYVSIQRRLLGQPLRSLDAALLDRVLELVELQARAEVDDSAFRHARNFAAYQSLVLFDGWDNVWQQAEQASPEAAEFCNRLRRELQPVWGHALAATDFSHNDLNLSNILVENGAVAGIVDWDEFGLNSRAADLTTLAFECAGSSAHAVDRLASRTIELAGSEGALCLVAYRAIAHLAALYRNTEAHMAPHVLNAAELVLERVRRYEHVD
jgi:aminoglycoside phosphotransferase